MAQHSAHGQLIEPPSVEFDFERERLTIVGSYCHREIRQFVQFDLAV